MIPHPSPCRIDHVITRLIIGGAQENTLASVLGIRQFPEFDVRLLSGPTEGPEGSLEPLAAEVPHLWSLIPSLVRPVHPAQDARALLALARHFRRRQPHFVHTHSGKAGILGRLAARAAGVPRILHTIHGPSFGPFQGALANATFLTAERLAARCTHHFVVVAQAMARQYLAAGIGSPHQYSRIFSGFNLDPFLHPPDPLPIRTRLHLDPSHFVVAKVARLTELKGHDDLIAAAPDLVRDLPHLRFLLIGDGPWRPRIEADIAARNLSPHFVFTGLVPPADIAPLIAASDIVVHLSRREGLARALPQSLAAARPVIAYDCDGANEVCLNGRTGYLIPVGNLTALRERIRLLAADPRLRTELGQRGRDLARESFSTERMVRDLIDLYTHLSPTPILPTQPFPNPAPT
jgi:glycosyltransferase involved in cell wall biosynthesis